MVSKERTDSGNNRIKDVQPSRTAGTLPSLNIQLKSLVTNTHHICKHKNSSNSDCSWLLKKYEHMQTCEHHLTVFPAAKASYATTTPAKSKF